MTQTERGEAPSSARVRDLTLTNFRGTRGTTTVSFERDGRPTSVLIAGENGVGKSTLTDALEFALQGTVGRQRPSLAAGRPRLVYHDPRSTNASVSARLSDGTKSDRTVKLSDGGLHVDDYTPHPSFRLAPVAIKRTDIVKFFATKPEQRGALFRDVLVEASSGESKTNEQIEDLKDEERSAKRRVASAAASLARVANIERPSDTLAARESLKTAKRLHALSSRSSRQEQSDAILRAIQVLEGRIAALDQVQLNIRNTRAQVQSASPVLVRQLQLIHSGMGDVSGWLTELFGQITGLHDRVRISARFAELSDISIELDVSFDGGEAAHVERLLSEGQLDLLSLLYFLAVLRQATLAGQGRVLVLDDVFQSVDSGVRYKLLDSILSEFAHWQLFLTVHDRMWWTQVRELMADHHIEPIVVSVKYDHDQRSSLYNADTGESLVNSIRQALETDDWLVIASTTGRVHEAMASRLSWMMRAAIPRKEQDNYTLADLWDPVVKKLRRSNITELTLEVDKYAHLRNAVGAHENSWALNAPKSDVVKYAEALRHMLMSVYCEECGSWVKGPADGPLKCRCDSEPRELRLR